MNLSDENGTLDKFHLGVSADGQSCMMIFIDEDHETESGRKVREVLLVNGYQDGRYQVEQV